MPLKTSEVVVGYMEHDVLVYHLHDCLFHKELTIGETNDYFRENLHLVDYRVTPYRNTDATRVSVTYTPTPSEDEVEDPDYKSLAEEWSVYIDDLPKLYSNISLSGKKEQEKSNGT